MRSCCRSRARRPWRSWCTCTCGRAPGAPRALYRSVYSAATIVLACVGAGAVVGFVGQGPAPLTAAGVPGITLALLVYTTINTGLVAGAIAMSAPQPDLARVIGRWDDNLLEFATLSLGALTAVA
ncbi:hypothetical protein BJF90_11625 [Pseudonocardia sp. CNS-004]|nr:hypothetical protein BJF90_11625 [Pseudonocardia sp. CNS-004]